MRKSLILVSILLASIFFSLDLSPPVDAQGVSPNLSVQLDCDDYSEDTWGVWEVGIGYTNIVGQTDTGSGGYCQITNPTEYVIDVEIIQDTTSELMCCLHFSDSTSNGSNPNSHVTGMESLNVTLNSYSQGELWIFINRNEFSSGSHIINISARVTSASGMPCTTCTPIYDEVEAISNQLGDFDPKLPDVNNNQIQFFTYGNKCWGQFDDRTITPLAERSIVGNGSATFPCVLGHPQGKLGRTMILDINGTIDFSFPMVTESISNINFYNNSGDVVLDLDFGAYLCIDNTSLGGYRVCESSVAMKQVQFQDWNNLGQYINISLPVSSIIVTPVIQNISSNQTDEILGYGTISSEAKLDFTMLLDDLMGEWFLTSCGTTGTPPNCSNSPLITVFEDINHIASVTFPIIDIENEDGETLPPPVNNTNTTNDTDGDGVPDSEDTFPNDANETHDDDNDGVGNNSDAFPQDANETHDDDGDGVGNNSDIFPQDPEETIDTDGDGVGDNSDADPDDPEVRIPADLEINVTDTALYVLAAAFLLMAVALVVNRRKKPPEVMGASEVYDSDTIWNES